MIERLLRGIGARLRSLRYFMADLLYLVSRPFRGAGERIGSAWRSISPQWRLRGIVAASALALVLLAAFVVVPNLPCGAPGGDECAPDDDAIELVPADALAYVHVNVEAGTEQAENAATLAARTPLLARQVLRQIQPFFLGAAGEPPDFGGDIEPWFGGEIAVAVVPGRAGTEQVQMLEVADPDGAREYEDSIGAGTPEPEEYQGTEIREDERGLATAVVGGFLVVGSADGVRAIIDVYARAEDTEALADDETVNAAFDALPEESLAQAYLSTEGIDSFLALARGDLASFEAFVDSGDSLGAAFALAADESGYLVSSRSVLDPERDEEAGGFFAAFEPFSPLLPAEIAPDTLAYLGFGNADETISGLLEQATVRAPAIASGFSDLADRLRKDAGVDLADELLPALNGEGAVAVAPRPDMGAASAADPTEDQVPDELQSPDAPERVQDGGSETPYLQFIADDVDEDAAADALARLQGELAEAVDPELAKPVFREESLGDVTAQVLRRSPTEIIAYAIAEGKLVVADDIAPIERLDANPDTGLAEAEGYESAVAGLADEPSLIGYLDLSGLVAAAERLGAGTGAEGPFASFAEDLRSLQTFAVTVGTEEDILSGDARLRVAAP